MKPLSKDEKQILLARIVRELAKARKAAGTGNLGMLAFLLAQAEDEAQNQLAWLEGDIFPEDE